MPYSDDFIWLTASGVLINLGLRDVFLSVKENGVGVEKFLIFLLRSGLHSCIIVLISFADLRRLPWTLIMVWL